MTQALLISQLQTELNEKLGQPITSENAPHVRKYKVDLNTFCSFEIQEIFRNLDLNETWESLIATVNIETLQDLNIVPKNGNINTRDANGNSPLTLAIDQEKYGIANFLIKRKANVNSEQKNVNIPLISAALKNQFQLVKCLVEAGAEVEDLYRYTMDRVPVIDRITCPKIISYFYSFWQIAYNYICNRDINRACVNYSETIVPIWNEIADKKIDKSDDLYPFIEFAQQKKNVHSTTETLLQVEPVEVLMVHSLLHTPKVKLKAVVDDMIEVLKSTSILDRNKHNFDQKFYDLMLGLKHKISDPVFHQDKKLSHAPWWQFGSIFAFCTRDTATLDDIQMHELSKANKKLV